jgi:hypothetical protein
MAFSSGGSMGRFAKGFTESLKEFFKAFFKVFFSEGGCA